MFENKSLPLIIAVCLIGSAVDVSAQSSRQNSESSYTEKTKIDSNGRTQDKQTESTTRRSGVGADATAAGTTLSAKSEEQKQYHYEHQAPDGTVSSHGGKDKVSTEVSANPDGSIKTEKSQSHESHQ